MLIAALVAAARTDTRNSSATAEAQVKMQDLQKALASHPISEASQEDIATLGHPLSREEAAHVNDALWALMAHPVIPLPDQPAAPFLPPTAPVAAAPEPSPVVIPIVLPPENSGGGTDDGNEAGSASAPLTFPAGPASSVPTPAFADDIPTVQAKPEVRESPEIPNYGPQEPTRLNPAAGIGTGDPNDDVPGSLVVNKSAAPQPQILPPTGADPAAAAESVEAAKETKASEASDDSAKTEADAAPTTAQGEAEA